MGHQWVQHLREHHVDEDARRQRVQDALCRPGPGRIKRSRVNGGAGGQLRERAVPIAIGPYMA